MIGVGADLAFISCALILKLNNKLVSLYIQINVNWVAQNFRTRTL